MQYYNLPANKSAASPGNIIFFDTESYYDPDTAYQTGQYHKLRLGVAIAGRLEGGRWTREKVCRFADARTFWEFVASRSHPRLPVSLYAHNVGYDLLTTGFPERLWNGEFRIFDPKSKPEGTEILRTKRDHNKGFFCLENPPVIIACTHRDDWKLIVIDTFNYWTSSLAKIGEMVGVPKTTIPLVSESDDNWYDYCENDVRVLQKAVLGLIGWVKENNLGKFRYTAPSMAMASLRHRFLTPKIVCHDNVPLRTFERQSYYGGRLEAWYIGETNEKTYELDVTSLYPSVMADNFYPRKIASFSTVATHTRVAPCKIELDTVAEILLKTRDCFPKRVPTQGTIYPVGEYWTTLAGPELIRARDSGAIQEVRQWIKFDMADLFTPFVNFFWQYRAEMLAANRQLEAGLAKLVMNGLYGKFGQKTAAWIDRPDLMADGSMGDYLNVYDSDQSGELFRNIGQCVQQFTGKKEHQYAFPAIAAYVTSYARERMLSLRSIAGFRNCFYIATDALFVNQAGYDNLDIAGQIHNSALGLLKVKASADTATFEALHHYQIGDRQVKGSRKKSGREQPDGSVVELQFESLESALKRKPDGSVHVKPVIKHYRKEYTRGIIGDDGWVTPLTLNEV